MATTALEQILYVGADEAIETGCNNEMCTYVVKANGLKKIKELRQHPNKTVKKKCIQILENFFGY